MTANEKRVKSGDVELISAATGKIRIIVRDSDIRISNDRREASNGALVQDQDVQPIELKSDERLYAYTVGNSTARIEVYE